MQTSKIKQMKIKNKLKNYSNRHNKKVKCNKKRIKHRIKIEISVGFWNSVRNMIKSFELKTRVIIKRIRKVTKIL